MQHADNTVGRRHKKKSVRICPLALSTFCPVISLKLFLFLFRIIYARIVAQNVLSLNYSSLTKNSLLHAQLEMGSSLSRFTSVLEVLGI